MNHSQPAETRLLAIDPTHRGLGYAVIERGIRLVDWGVRGVSPDRKNSDSLRRVSDLVARYEPDIIVMEASWSKEPRRCPRIERLARAVERMAAKRDIEVRKVSRTMLEAAFFQAGTLTKHEIALAIARRFPQLTAWLPPARKTWTSENYKMSIFDAAALGLACFHEEEDGTRIA